MERARTAAQTTLLVGPAKLLLQHEDATESPTVDIAIFRIDWDEQRSSRT
jgi:hypothetical protein